MSKDSPNTPVIRFKKILVALDASSHSMAALETAAQLAQQLEAELHGLFIEDENWFALSKLPITAEISDLTGTLRRMEEGDIERHVMSLASRIQRAIEQRARQHRIKHQFEIRRGHVDEELLDASRQADLITLGRIGHSVWGGTEVGKTAQRLIEESDKPLLLLQQGYRLGGQVTVVDQEEDREALMNIATSLANQLGVTLNVLNLSDKVELRKESERAIDDIVKPKYPNYRIYSTSYATANQFSYLVRRLNTGMLIADRQSSLLQGRNFERIVTSIQCPMLLI